MSEEKVGRKVARELDDTLSGRAVPEDPEVQALTTAAARLERALDFDTPTAARERAMFVSAVAARHVGFNPARLIAPAIALAAVIALVFTAGRTALPGESLYPVRKALGTVGLAKSTLEEVDSRIARANRLLTDAEIEQDDNPGTALRLAVQAFRELGPATDLLEELEGDARDTRMEAIESLEGRAIDIIMEVGDADEDQQPDDVEDENEDNSGPSENSGPGSDDSGDDNSGPGSDDSGSDNSGSGSDDTSGSGDNSGPGSDDSGGGDNSGSGSDGSGSDSDDTTDSSGSGSGSDDDSGSGSGSDDDSGSGSD